jgi:hypothetical protein
MFVVIIPGVFTSDTFNVLVDAFVKTKLLEIKLLAYTFAVVIEVDVNVPVVIEDDTRIEPAISRLNAGLVVLIPTLVPVAIIFPIVVGTDAVKLLSTTAVPDVMFVFLILETLILVVIKLAPTCKLPDKFILPPVNVSALI